MTDLLNLYSPCLLCGTPSFGPSVLCHERDCRDLPTHERMFRWNWGITQLRKEFLEFQSDKPSIHTVH